MRNKNINMTSGPLMRNMIAYTVPIILSGILQLLYSAADLVVVGQFAGSDAFAAVGATSSLNNLFITLFLAISNGGCICVAQYYGARDGKNVHETVHTCVAVSIISGLFVTVISLLFVDEALALMGTHKDIIDMSAKYLRIVLGAAPFTLFYNFAAGILRATGDTKRPFYILIFTGLVNVILNIILVVGFGMDVDGVAIATFVGAALNALIAGRILIKSGDSIRVNLKQLKIYPDKLKKVLNYGVPSGIQSLLFSGSNVIIQSAVNSFNSVAVIAGNAAASSIEGFIYTSMNSVSNAALNFAGQNYGARKYKRVTQSMICACIFTTVVGFAMGFSTNMFGDSLLSIYEPTNAAARSFGLVRFSIVAKLYFICGIYEILMSTLRGIGSSWAPTVIAIASVGGVRIMWVLFVFPHFHTLPMLYISWPLTWITSIVLLLIVYLTRSKKLFEKNEEQYRNESEKLTE